MSDKPDKPDKPARKPHFEPPGPVVPLEFIKFASNQVQVAGRLLDATDALLKTEKRADGKQWLVDYLPALRHHRITFIDRDKPPVVEYFHESQIRSWRPA